MRTLHGVIIGVAFSLAACGGGSSGTGAEDDGALDDASPEGGGDTNVDVDDVAPADAPDGDNADTSQDASLDATNDTQVDDANETSVDDSAAADVVETSVDEGVDSALDALVDSAIEATVDSTIDARDAAPESAVDGGVDTAPVDTNVCAPGTLCADGSICSGGTACVACTNDAACSAIAPGTLCYAGKCAAGTCHPKPATPTGCASNAACCATSSSAGTCFAPSSAATACCADADCVSQPVFTHCDGASHTCVCPQPTGEIMFVASKGSDVSGTGSSACPFQTIAHAVKAIPSGQPQWIINLVNDTAGPTIYGAGCSAGGSGCDATPIVLPATTPEITLRSPAGSANIVVRGGTSTADTAVILVQARGASVRHMTIVPNRLAIGGGAAGILIDAPAEADPSNEGDHYDLVMQGTGSSPIAPSTGPAFIVRGGANPLIGVDGNVVVTGGANGVLVQASTAAGVSGSAPTIGSGASISASAGACVRIESPTGAAGAMPSAIIDGAHLFDCHSDAAVTIDLASAPAKPISITNAAIDSTGVVPFDGVHLLRFGAATISDTTITDLASAPGATFANTTGIVAEGNASLTIAGNVHVQRDGRGVLVTGNATATIDGLIATDHTLGVSSDGLRCDASTTAAPFITMSVKNSVFLSNFGSGVMIAGGCNPTFGDATASGLGNDVFDTATQHNAQAGICDSNNTGLAFTVSAGRFTCPARPASGCTAASTPPTYPTSGASCAGADIGGAAATAGKITLLAPQCCDDVAVP